MPEAYLLSCARTPIGKFLGGLSELTAVQLGVAAARAAMERAAVPPDRYDEVIFGNVVQAGQGQNPARQVALGAGLPHTIAAFTVNKVCGSGLKAVMLAAQAIRAGDADLILAGGSESMSRAPHLLMNTRQGYKYGDQKVVDALIHDGLFCPFEQWPMGEAAEHTAGSCSVTRSDQDAFAAESHRRASVAWAEGAFADEVVAVRVGSGAKAQTVTQDEGIRPDTSAEGLAKLRPAFRADGTVTAGNASQLSDGAAAVVVASAAAADSCAAEPMARVVAYATSGVAPKDIFIAPVTAIRMALDKVKWSAADVDLFEINEAFAAQMVACMRGLDLDPDKVNIHGGGVALGHPIGASGARVLTTLAYALKRHNLRRGVAALCLGGGNAVAMVIER